MPSEGLVVDLFAGGGGASMGIEAALGRDVDIAINHDPIAIAVHSANHPNTKHYTTDVWEVDPKEACGDRHVALLHASPDCKDFSRAKGGKPKSKKIRSLAWVVHKWAKAVRPDVITVENVAEFEEWGPLGDDDRRIDARKGETFKRWKRELEHLGYVVDHRPMTASHYGAPTSRKRFFLIARCDGKPIAWPERTHGPGLLPYRTAAECIDWSLPCPSIFERSRPLAENTLRRIAAGVVRFVLGANPYTVETGGELVSPTLVQTGYGERPGQAPRALDLHQPLGTVVATGQKHGLVAAFLAKHYGGVVGQELGKPLGTVTAVDHHSLVTSSLGHGNHAQEIFAFLTTYYGNGADVGQALGDPLRTVVTKDRFGLVTVKLDGVDHVVTDIGLRMLEPHELNRAQFGRFAKSYKASAARTKKDAVRLTGNSVCPELEEAIVAANFPREIEQRAA